MKTFLATLAIVVCSTFALGDTIGPPGCADSVCLGASYTLNVINYTGNQLTVDYIIDGSKFTNGTGTIVTGHTDGIFSLSLNFSVPVTQSACFPLLAASTNGTPKPAAKIAAAAMGTALRMAA